MIPNFQYTKEYEIINKLTKYILYIFIFLSFFCICFSISNTTPLTILCVFGFIYCLKNKTYKNCIFILFSILFLYLSLTDYFLFPKTTGFSMIRRLFLAFFAGITAFSIEKSSKPTFPIFFTISLLISSLLCCMDNDELFIQNRLILWAIHPNQLAYFLSFSITVCIYFICNRYIPTSPLFGVNSVYCIITNKYILTLFTIIQYIILFLTDSRTSFYATLLITILVVSYAKIKKLRKFFLPFLVIVIATLVLYIYQTSKSQYVTTVTSSNRMFNALTNPLNDPTIRSRMAVWQSSWGIFKEHPFFGAGLDSWSDENHKFVKKNYNDFVEIYGKNIIDNDTLILKSAHNDGLMLLAETGITGFVLFFALMLAPIASSIQKKMSYGVTIPIIGLYFIMGLTGSHFHGNRVGYLGLTALFMLLGHCVAATQAKQGLGHRNFMR